MTLEGKDRSVGMVLWLAIGHSVLYSISVVNARVLSWHGHAGEVVIVDSLPDVPHLEELIFSIGSKIDSISFASDIGDTFCMTDKDPHWSIASQGSSIPDLDKRVITAREDDVGMLPIGEAHRVDLIVVSASHPRHHPICHQVINQKLGCLSSRQNLFSISRELE
jgi:hypothetical protein